MIKLSTVISSESAKLIDLSTYRSPRGRGFGRANLLCIFLSTLLWKIHLVGKVFQVSSESSRSHGFYEEQDEDRSEINERYFLRKWKFKVGGKDTISDFILFI